MHPPSRRAVRASLVVLGVVVLSVVASWPLAYWAAAVFPSSPDMPDLNVSIWLPWHVGTQLADGASPFDAPGLQHPHGQRISLLVWNLALQAVQVPLYALLPPVLAYNLSLVLLGAGNGLGGYVLGRAVAPESRAGGLLGAVLLGASPFAWSELAQGRVEQGFLGLFAVVVAGLWRLGQAPARRLALATGLAWGLAGLCYWFYGYFLALLLGALLLVGALRRRWDQVQAWALAGATAAAVAAPFALALGLEALDAGSAYRSSTAEDPALVQRLTQVIHNNSLGLHGTPLWWLAPPNQLRDVLPVVSVALVLGATLWRRAGARWLGPLALVGLVLALGPQLQWEPGHPVLVSGHQLTLPLAALRELVPGFARLWWPYRFLVFWTVGAAGCGAALVARLGDARLRWGLAAGLSLLALGELRVAQGGSASGLLWDAPQARAESAFFARLAASEQQQPLLFLPYQAPTTGRVLWQAVHHQPVSIGLGDADDMLVSQEVQDWIAADPVLTWLRATGRRQTSGPPPKTGAALRAHLRELGFAWAVLWRSPPQPGQRERYEQAFGSAADVREDLLLAWKL